MPWIDDADMWPHVVAALEARERARAHETKRIPRSVRALDECILVVMLNVRFALAVLKQKLSPYSCDSEPREGLKNSYERDLSGS